MSWGADGVLQEAYLIFLLLGGYDDQEQRAYLCSIDYIGNQYEATYLVQGTAGRFCTSIFDQTYRKGELDTWTLAATTSTIV